MYSALANRKSNIKVDRSNLKYNQKLTSKLDNLFQTSMNPVSMQSLLDMALQHPRSVKASPVAA